MPFKKLKAIFILGPDETDQPLPEEFKNLYTKPGYLLIGDSKKDISFDDILRLKGKIDENTRIDILVHGGSYLSQHTIGLSLSRRYQTREFFETLKIINNNSPLHIHLWSCHAGLAYKDIIYLPEGSVLITHGLATAKTHSSLYEMAFKLLTNNFQSSQVTQSPFEIFLKELLINSLQTCILTTFQNNKIHAFEVNPDLEEVIKAPQEVLLNIRLRFREFHTKLQKENQDAFNNNKGYLVQPLKEINLPSFSFTQEAINEFILGCFIYKCSIGDNQALTLLQSSFTLKHRILEFINKDINGLTLLYIATQVNLASIVKLLLEHSANINQATSDGITPLFIAALYDYTGIANILLTNNANTKIARNHDGVTPLLIAIQKRHTEVIKLLLIHNTDANQATNDGITPIIMSAQKGSLEVVELLIKHKANINHIADSGITALILAAENGYAEITKTLLINNAHVDHTTNSGTTALFLASQNGHIEVVKLLIEYNASIDKANDRGITSFFIAIQENHIEIINLLLKHNADINQAANDGTTPFFMAVQNGI